MQLFKAVVNAHHYLRRQNIHSSFQGSRVRPQPGEQFAVKEATKEKDVKFFRPVTRLAILLTTINISH